MLKKFKTNKIGNKISHKISYKAELLCISILTVALVFLGWAYIFQETNKYKDSVSESFGANQEVLVNQVMKSVKGSLEDYAAQGVYSAQAEEAVVSNVIKKAETSGSRYWFFYSTEGVIFERDVEETRNVKGKSLIELEQYWKLHGGREMEAFTEMLSQERNGSAIFSKHNETGNEIITMKYFTAGDRNYYLGMSTEQDYVMNTAQVNEHILYLWTFSALVSLDILIFSLLLCLRIYKHQKESEKLNKSIINKSLQIQQLNQKLSSKSEAVQNASIYDSLTKLYNRKFFDNLLTRVNHDLLQPVSIVVLDINGLGYLNTVLGYNAGDELLEKTSDILRKACIDTDVIARTGSSEFTILMTGTKEEQAYGTAENMKRQFNNLEHGDLTLSMGVAQMPTKETNIYTVMQTVRKNLILDKMMDSNSNSSNIVSMLMETLSAFSREAVDHCDRLKNMALSFGRMLGLSPPELSRLAVAAQLHDVGKIGIPDSVLNKKENLNEQDKELIRRHSEVGYNIVKAIAFLDEVAIDVLQHHECYDGTGYPEGLRGDEITLNARIINIVDSFDAMTHDSVYASAKTVEEAVNELCMKSGTQYDPHLIAEFVKEITNRIAKKNGERQ